MSVVGLSPLVHGTPRHSTALKYEHSWLSSDANWSRGRSRQPGGFRVREKRRRSSFPDACPATDLARTHGTGIGSRVGCYSPCGFKSRTRTRVPLLAAGRLRRGLRSRRLLWGDPRTRGHRCRGAGSSTSEPHVSPQMGLPMPFSEQDASRATLARSSGRTSSPATKFETSPCTQNMHPDIPQFIAGSTNSSPRTSQLSLSNRHSGS